MTPLERFALAVLAEHRENLCDIEGGWLQDKAQELGLLVEVHVTESCGENCRCAEWDDFPQECLRPSKALARAMKKLATSTPAARRADCGQ